MNVERMCHGRIIGATSPLPCGTRVLIGLGGNIGGSEAIHGRFRHALARLTDALASPSTRLSAIYGSDPVGPIAEQPRFLNAVAEFFLVTTLSPYDLLAEILSIEASLGRVRTEATDKGPRTIDLDLLFAGDWISSGPGIELPHSRVFERAFVLRPLAELVGLDWLMPGFGRTVADCLNRPELAAQRRGLTLHAPGAVADDEYCRDALPR